jgi:hypothetical protein
VTRQPIPAGRSRHGGRYRVMVNLFQQLRLDPVALYPSGGRSAIITNDA